MLLNFDNIDVMVNGSGIASTNSTISTTNTVEPAYIIGYKAPINQLPYGGIKTVFNSSYVPVISQEPNYAVLNNIKNLSNDSAYYGEKINIGGLTSENFFMDSYSLKIQPNNIVDASVSYSTYWELCGSLRIRSNTVDYFNQGDVCHSWSTYILQTGDNINKPTYEFSYDCKINWIPIYTIGNKFPKEMRLLDISESVSFNIDEYRQPLFTGENLYPNIFSTNNANLDFKNISLLCENNCEDLGNVANKLSINLSGFKIKSSNIVAQVGEMVRTNYIATRYY